MMKELCDFGKKSIKFSLQVAFDSYEIFHIDPTVKLFNFGQYHQVSYQVLRNVFVIKNWNQHWTNIAIYFALDQLFRSVLQKLINIFFKIALNPLLTWLIV